MANVNPIPEGFHTLTPHIVVADAAKAIDFYKKAFGAEEMFSMPGPDGAIMHSELRIGDSVLMMCQANAQMGAVGPDELKGSPVTLHIYTNDADALMKRAEQAGAKVTMPAASTFWGDRYGRIQDPFGHNWSIATHVEDLTPDQMRERAAKMMGGHERGDNCCDH